MLNNYFLRDIMFRILIIALFGFLISFSVVKAEENLIYKGVCDASAGEAIGSDYFLLAADEYNDNGEDQGDFLFLFSNNESGKKYIKKFKLPSALRKNPERETDTEASARIGERIFWITSHGRNKKGKFRPNRYRLYATDISGSSSDLKVKFAGFYKDLVKDLIDKSNWTTTDVSSVNRLIKKVEAVTRLNERLPKGERKKLAPKKLGLNIEGLSALPDNSGLLIGLRNPTMGGKAIIVKLSNVNSLFSNSKTKGRFEGPFELDLGGLGIRSMSYVKGINGFLIIAGPKNGGGPFKLFKWSGPQTSKIELVQSLTGGKGSSPEALVSYFDKDKVLILNDEGSKKYNGKKCKKSSIDQQQFGGRWYSVK